MSQPASFDRYADDYDGALAQGLSATGEAKEYFARGRIDWLAGEMARRQFAPKTVLDFGCGTGTAAPFLFESFPGIERLIGTDISGKSIAAARRVVTDPRALYLCQDEYEPDGTVDLVYCNGVFHHIPPAQRPGAIAYIRNGLRPGGYFALWENNPWNPGTRLVMKRCAYNRDAIPLPPPAARKVVAEGGVEVVSTRFLFVFPRSLQALRGIEPALSGLPIGGQYEVLSRKPGG